MSDLILCPGCGHSIEHHDSFGCQMCKIDPVTCWAPQCRESSSSIARAYAEERWLDGVDVGYVLGRFHSKRDEKGHRE